MYRCARDSEWGDRLPLHYEQQQENSEETETVEESETSKNENT